jgi:hypothetical protein
VRFTARRVNQANGFLTTLFIDIGHEHLGTALSQQLRRGSPYAAAATGYDNRTAIKPNTIFLHCVHGCLH